MRILTWSNDRTGFTKDADGLFYQFENEFEAHVGCGLCTVYDVNKENILKRGYCLDFNYIADESDDLELLRHKKELDVMFEKINK
jgi:hypothetical protein